MEDARVSDHRRGFDAQRMMNTPETFPFFDDCLPELNQFILKLVEAYEAGKLSSWEHLEERVSAYFTPERMEQMESLVPGWQKMASGSDGITLVHVMCVFLGLFILPEFKNLTPEQKQLAKWIVLFHDVEKESTIGAGERDKTHAFRSAVLTARRLPEVGFAVRPEYGDLAGLWNELTRSAVRVSRKSAETIQDNEKLPEILRGIEGMFGQDTPATIIVKSVLLHMSINAVRDWPQAAPLREAEIKMLVNESLAPLLKVMMLADNEGWSLFDPETRAVQRNETLEAFEELERLISQP